MNRNTLAIIRDRVGRWSDERFAGALNRMVIPPARQTSSALPFVAHGIQAYNL
jgi:hypothetical protein